MAALLAPEQLFRASLTGEGVALVRCAAISIWPVTAIYSVLEVSPAVAQVLQATLML